MIAIINKGLDEQQNTVFGVGLKFKINPLDFEIHAQHESTKESTEGYSTSIEFSLGDDDPGDEFVVDLFLDERHGTVVFETKGGEY